MHFINEEEVDRHLPMKDAISILEEAFEDCSAGHSSYSTRNRLKLSRGALVTMPGYFHKYNLAGLKTYTSGQRKYRHVLVLNAATGEPVALIESSRMGQLKTGALPAMVTRKLLRGRNQSLCLIGSGFQAAGQLEGMMEAFSLDKVNVYSRTPANARKFAAEMSSKYGVDVQAHEDVKLALKGCTIVSSATNSDAPVFSRADLGDSYHVNLIGANFPSRREAARDVMDSSDLVVVEDMAQAAIESSEIMEMEDHSKCVELRDLFRSPIPAGMGKTVFKSMGVGLDDIAVAYALLKNMKKLPE